MTGFSKVKLSLASYTWIAKQPNIGGHCICCTVQRNKMCIYIYPGKRYYFWPLHKDKREEMWFVQKFADKCERKYFLNQWQIWKDSIFRWMRSRQNVSSFQICFYKFFFFFFTHTDKHTLNLANKYFTLILCCHWHVCTARIKSTRHFQGHAKASASLHSSALLRADFFLWWLSLAGTAGQGYSKYLITCQFCGLTSQMQLVKRGSCFCNSCVFVFNSLSVSGKCLRLQELGK